MLSLTQQIFAGEIESMTQLADRHPVYLLEGHGNDKVVVKMESTIARQDMARNARVMAAVDRRAATHLMSVTEVQQLMSWAIAAKAHADSETRNMLQTFLAFTKAQGAWTKMAPYNLLDLNHAHGLLNSSKEKAEVRELASALNSSGGMEQLGQIVAADLFNGNNDRFNVSFPLNESATEGMGYRDEAGLHHLNHLYNIGNIMIVRGSHACPIGLDAFDPYGKFGNWNVSLASEEQAKGAWPGRFLAATQAANRHKLALRFVADLNALLGGRNRKLKIFSKVRLNHDACVRMNAGMTRGIDQIKQLLLSRYRGRAPIGLKDRAAILGCNL